MFHQFQRLLLPILSCAAIGFSTSRSEETAGDRAAVVVDEPEVVAGHSYHGETFNEGPRQAARRMTGLAHITFPTAAKNAEAQAFVEQGIAQLHGFWYLEAERSFRQAASMEKDLAIAYWGCAMANINNRERAMGFSQEAMKRLGAPTSAREKLYIESFDRYLKASGGKSTPDKTDAEKKEAKLKAHARYISDLEKIIDDFPDDVEAKAFLVLQLWWADGEGLKMPSRYAVSALLDGIFAVQPMHPAHHYRIHLWDGSRPKNALGSAAKAGPSMPGVAHMWHMPGHTYSKLFRYADAVWQQEAAARVDHAHMIDSKLLPDQIHNFAHNNEWMVRNLLYLGRIEDAIRHSKQLIDLPRHPKFNTSKKGSFRFGRERLLQALTSYGLWEQLISEGSGPYLADIDSEDANQERDAWLAVAHFMQGDRQKGGDGLRRLQRAKLELQTKQLDEADARAKVDASEDAAEAKKDIAGQIKRLQGLIARVAAAAAAKRGDKEAVDRNAKLAKLDPIVHSQWLAIANDLEAAQKIAEKAVRDGRNQVRPLAVLVDILWRRDQKEEAKKRFTQLRNVAFSADLQTPLLHALAPLVEAAKIEGDWRLSPALASDIGERPQWSSLGPESWQPYASLPFEVTAPDGDLVSSDDWNGKPRIVFFYLGFGCLHCVEQLQAFSPAVAEFQALGVDVVAISNEDTATLSKGIAAFGESIPIKLFSDSEQVAFKAYRCWDDFESIPLHGTFLIDAEGRVRWQDVGAEPFNDIAFMLSETNRLLTKP